MNAAPATPITTQQDPATGAGAEAITPAAGAWDEAAPVAIVLTVIRRDRITQNVQLYMGGSHIVHRDFHRAPGSRGSWTCRDPEFIDHEDRIGIELAEYADALPLPQHVADMLPRPGNRTAEARAAAVAAIEGLRHD